MRTGRLHVIALAGVALALAASAAWLTWHSARGRAPVSERERVEAVIRRYNTLLAQGYSSLDMDPLQEVATPAQAQKEYYHMAAIGEAGLRLIARQDRMAFREVSLSASRTASVITEERWDYTQAAIDSGAPRARDVTDYVLRYELQQQPAGWLVSKITAIETRPGPRPDSTLPTSAVPFEEEKRGPVFVPPERKP